MTPPPTIPLHRPALSGDEASNLTEALAGGHTAAGGPWSARASALLGPAVGAQEVLLTTSCTAALELAALLLDVGPGDTVIVPSFTFPSTAAAFARAGARLRFCDIEPRTLGLDPAVLSAMVDETVVAVVAVHYGGTACDVEGIDAVLRAWPRAHLVEDNAHGLFGTAGGRPLGSFGALSTLSFHQSKTFSCGEGGALALGPGADVERAWVLWDKGTDRQAFLRGRTPAYAWQEVGSSFGLSDLLAAPLVAQLGAHERWITHRRQAVRRYLDRLAPHAEAHGITLLPALGDDGSAAHLFPVLLPRTTDRATVIDLLARRGVQSAFHYVPLHSSPAGRRTSSHRDPCPVTDDVASRLLRLPLDSVITDDEVDAVVEALVAALRDAR